MALCILRSCFEPFFNREKSSVCPLLDLAYRLSGSRTGVAVPAYLSSALACAVGYESRDNVNALLLEEGRELPVLVQRSLAYSLDTINDWISDHSNRESTHDMEP